MVRQAMRAGRAARSGMAESQELGRIFSLAGGCNLRCPIEVPA